MDVYDLGVIVKDIGNFDMSDFGGRLRFQKTIHLLQSFGIDLGYSYNWYIRGPYCPTLAEDGFALNYVIGDTPKLTPAFADSTDQSNYERFKRFISDKKTSPDQLEIASSICFLSDEGMNKKTVLRLTEGKQERFTMEECERIWGELERCGAVMS